MQVYYAWNKFVVLVYWYISKRTWIMLTVTVLHGSFKKERLRLMKVGNKNKLNFTIEQDVFSYNSDYVVRINMSHSCNK